VEFFAHAAMISEVRSQQKSDDLSGCEGFGEITAGSAGALLKEFLDTAAPAVHDRLFMDRVTLQFPVL
jgi:hypothetical protein